MSVSETVDRLLDAFVRRDRETIDELARRGAELDAPGDDGKNVLMRAAELGQTDAVAWILEAGARVDQVPPAPEDDLRIRYSGGRTPLMLAAAGGHAETVRLLVDAGAAVDRRIAATDFLRAVATVLQRRAAAGKRLVLDDEGASALLLAAGNGHAEAVKILVAAGAELNLRDADGDSAILRAARAGHEDVVALLLAAGARNDGLASARLLAAVGRGDAATVRQQLQVGAHPDVDVDVARQGRCAALFLAAALGHGEIVSALCAAGADPNVEVRGGLPPWDQTPLLAAAAAGHTEAVRALLQAGADTEARDRDVGGGGRTAVMRAAEAGHVEILKLLQGAGARIDARDRTAATALIYAAANGQSAAVGQLLDWGASLGNRRWSSLVCAAENGHLETVEVLLDAGAEPDVHPFDQWSPIAAATAEGAADVVARLLEAGANPDGHRDATTPLVDAIALGYDDVVGLLLDAGAELNPPTGRPPLIEAIARERAEIVGLLLDRGADPDARDDDGTTPLMWAAIRGSRALVEALLDAGALLNATDGEARTAFSCALEREHADLVAFFEELGAKRGRLRVDDGGGEDRAEEETPLAEARGIETIHRNSRLVLVRAGVEVVARAFHDHRGAETWERGVYGSEVTLTHCCHVVVRFTGHSWTMIRDLNVHLLDPVSSVNRDDARVLSGKLGAAAIYFSNSHTSDCLDYAYFENGRRRERVQIHLGGFEDDDFDESYFDDEELVDFDDAGEAVTVDPKDWRFESQLRSIDKKTVRDPFRLVDKILRRHGAYAPSWSVAVDGRAGRAQRLEIPWLEPDEIERMDFVAKA